MLETLLVILVSTSNSISTFRCNLKIKHFKKQC